MAEYIESKHQTAAADAVEIAQGLEQVAGDAAKKVRAELTHASRALEDDRVAAEAAITALSEAKATVAARQRSLKLGVDMALAYSRAEVDDPLSDFAAQRVRGSDATIAGLMVGKLREGKSPMALAIANYLSRKIDEARVVGQTVVELTQTVTDVSGVWSAEYYRVISLTNLGKSLQQEAGVEVPKKKKRAKAKKKIVSPPQSSVTEPSDSTKPDEIKAA